MSKFAFLLVLAGRAAGNICADYLTLAADPNSKLAVLEGNGKIVNGNPMSGQPFDYWNFSWSAPAVEGESEDDPFPNGFRTGIVHRDNNPPFCVTYPGSKGRVVRLMVEMQMDGIICIADQSFDPRKLDADSIQPERCVEGRQLHSCFDAETSEDVKLVFFCRNSCPESPMAFYYKFMETGYTRAEWDAAAAADGNFADNNPDMWCPMLEGTKEVKFPSDLALEPALPDEIANRDLSQLSGAMVFGPSAFVAAGVAIAAALQNV